MADPLTNPIPGALPDNGTGCGHNLCLFERDCLVIQAEAVRP